MAVVTPYHLEDSSVIKRCWASVVSQSVQADAHIWVADGHPSAQVSNLANSEHIVLPVSHADAGATPRAIGAMSAFSRGYDAVAFLDVDNTYEPDHLAQMLDLMANSSPHVVTATRNICTLEGQKLFVDRQESTGNDFCDTNCLFIGRSCLNLLTYWITSPAARLWSDRHFWSAIKQSGAKTSHCSIPTVNYYSRWAWHYQHAGLEPPDDTVWIHNDNGMLVHTKHKHVRTSRNEG